MSIVDRADVSHRRARAGRIREGVKSYIRTLADVAAAWAERDWEVLGYDSWDEYVKTEFDADRLGLPAEQRQKAVVELRMAGLSQREIASAVNVGVATVNRDLRGVPNETRELESPQVTDSGPTGAADHTPPADPDETPADRDPDPSFLPGPAVATTGQPDQPEGVAPEAEGTSGATSSAEPPAGPSAVAVHSDRPGLAEQTELARWQAGFLAQVHAVHKVLRYPVADVVAMADDECLSELRRVVQLATRYLDDIDTLARAELPANVTPIRRAQ